MDSTVLYLKHLRTGWKHFILAHCILYSNTFANSKNYLESFPVKIEAKNVQAGILNISKSFCVNSFTDIQK